MMTKIMMMKKMEEDGLVILKVIQKLLEAEVEEGVWVIAGDVLQEMMMKMMTEEEEDVDMVDGLEIPKAMPRLHETEVAEVEAAVEEEVLQVMVLHLVAREADGQGQDQKAEDGMVIHEDMQKPPKKDGAIVKMNMGRLMNQSPFLF